jgi:hypothetical protein
MSRDEKTLLPEFLPLPQTEDRRTPKERVTEQARLLLQRFRAIGVTAGTAILSVQCGSGYGVVDPLPNPPAQCSTLPNPIPALYATARPDSSADGGVASLALELRAYSVVGLRVDAVRVTGGTLVSIADHTTGGPGGSTLFVVTIAPDGSGGALLVDVDLGCGSAPTTTKQYRLTPQAGSDAVTVMEVVGSQL